MDLPFQQLTEWLERENQLTSSTTAYFAVLATATSNAIPHSRVVAIREITSDSIVFFTQRHTRKFQELIENPQASITFWLAKQCREVILEGKVEPLTPDEHQHYWQLMPRERQLRFSTYAPTSTQAISSLSELEIKHQALIKQFQDQEIPMSNFYCGFRLHPTTFHFYTLGQDCFSESIRFTLENNTWQQQLLSP